MPEEINSWGCDNCAFFAPMKEQKRTDSRIGNCHVNAPVLDGDSTIGRFPIVISTMWCGQYQEAK
jgi:hypothetical protein